MLDYEGIYYTVEFYIRAFWHKQKFTTEDEAIEFIKAHRANWEKYRLVKSTYAIIDF